MSLDPEHMSKRSTLNTISRESFWNNRPIQPWICRHSADPAGDKMSASPGRSFKPSLLLLRRPRLKSQQRSQSGSQLTEIGPAITILFLLMLPLALNLMMIGLAWISGYLLNQNQTRQAALTHRFQASARLRAIADDWQQGSLGQLVKMRPIKQARSRGDRSGIIITYFTGEKDPRQGFEHPDRFVAVTTTAAFDPFLPIPLIPGLPGFSAPFEFTYSSARLLEDPRHYEEPQRHRGPGPPPTHG